MSNQLNPKTMDSKDWKNLASSKPLNAYSIFCGVLEYSKDIHEEVKTAKEFGFKDWKIHILREELSSEEIIKKFNDYYYENFVNTIFLDINNSDPDRFNSEFAKRTARLSLEINQEHKITITKRDSEQVFKIKFEYLDLFFFPDGIVFYCFKCDLSNFSFDDITLINSYIRRNSGAKDDGMEFLYNKLSFLEVAADAKIDALSFGNKLKVFIIIEHEKDLNKEDENMLLYDFGACVPIGSAFGKEPKDQPSEEFLKEIIENNKICVYNNWSALALFDTFTGLFQKEALKKFDWENGYFNLLYLQSLYVKNHLFKVNKAFYTKDANHQKLDDELFKFVKYYNPSHISYNFLPALIFKKIRYSLAIKDELDQLKERIERTNQKRKEKTDKKMNDVLAVIAVLTIITVLWNASEWSEKLFIKDTPNYIIVSGLVVTLMLIVFGLLYLYRIFRNR